MAFTSSITLFGDKTTGFSSPTEQTIIHEIGHAVDKKGLNATSKGFFDAQDTRNNAVNEYNAALEIFQSLVKKYRNPTGTGYVFDTKEEHDDYNNLKAQYKIDELEKKVEDLSAQEGVKKTTMTSTVSPSGSKKILTDEGYKAAETATDTAFRQAAALDGGIRITDYSDDAWAEYFAESFSFFITDPNRMVLIRPNVYKYFKEGKYNG